MDYEECRRFAEKKHSGQKRKTGEDYFTHPLSVSIILKKHGFNVDYQCAGLFHDLLEDTNATHTEIEKLSNKGVADAVVLVTKEKGYNIDDYMARIKSNKMAHMVKLADRLHNLTTAIGTSEEFRTRYVKETEEHYLELARGTVFEKEIKAALEGVRRTLLK